MYWQFTFQSGLHTFDLLALEKAGFGLEFQRLWFPFIFIGFGVLGGLFPFHSWAPDGHVAAPTAVSMLLAGVEMKVGAFAALRAGLMLLPDGMRFWAPLVIYPGNDQCGLWRIHRHDPDRFQVCHRFFIRLAHGIGFHWICDPDP